MTRTDPIGVFDSGVGGLTVVSRLINRLPHEDIIYFGDTARVPYGIKSPATVREFSRQIAQFLLRRRVKAIVIACNTASAVALDTLRAELDVPVIGVIEAGARQALSVTQNHRVAVIGTASTVSSRAYPRALAAQDSRARTLSKACPLFVPLVEDAIFDGPVAEYAVHHYLDEICEAGVDTLLLGCTHYPLLVPVIQRVIGDGIHVVDAAEGTANELAELLEARELLNPNLGDGLRRYYFSDRTEAFQRLAQQIMGEAVADMYIVDLEADARGERLID